MRKRFFIFISTLFLLGCGILACKDSDDSPQDKAGLISANVSSCKDSANDGNSATREEGMEEDGQHHLEYEIGSDSRLYLKDINHYVPCSMTAFDVDATVKGDTITVTEKATTGDVVSSCFCPIDVDMVIGLSEKKTYTLVYAVEGLVPEKFTITNNPGQSGRFDPKAIDQPIFDMEVDGIYYNIISSDEQTVEVTYRAYYGEGYRTGYEGDIVIPGQITNKGKTYTVTAIGQYAFVANVLTSIYIPNTVKEIKGEMCFLNCPNLASVRLSDGMTKIPQHTFNGCTSLAEITIPESVTEICSNAFVYCENLTKIYVRSSKAPQIDISSFYDKTTQNATLYVPVGSKEAYSKADYWKNFAHIEEYDF